ncbi:MAG TPA: phosphatase PAP2 family protein [Gammaproteobacteria bacterium]|nr:phosphatase PAP2 family protein [Gammaproteobacteria bacterium]
MRIGGAWAAVILLAATTAGSLLTFSPDVRAQSAAPATAAPGPAGPASGPADAARAPGESARPRVAPAPGYLGRDRVPDESVFLPPPPKPDSALGKADLEIFRATRALEGSPRWQRATSDAAINQRALLEDFECAAGVDFDGAATPALTRLLQRSMADLRPVIGVSKDRYQRPRPFLVEQGPVCVATEPLARSGSYPSGHSATGWLYALLLAELAPDRAAEILARGRAYGESRVVCGVHFVSDVEAGRTAAAAVIAALNGTPEFDADVAAARRELDGLRAADASKPPAAQCSVEDGALERPW